MHIARAGALGGDVLRGSGCSTEQPPLVFATEPTERTFVRGIFQPDAAEAVEEIARSIVG